MNNRIFILFLICILLSIASVAQSFQGGIAAGLVGSQVNGDTYSGYNKPGAYAAAWIKFSVSERSNLQTELSYFQKGSRHNPDVNKGDDSFYLMRLGYIEMPFNYGYQLSEKISIHGGPAFSFLLHSYEEFNYIEADYGKFQLFNLAANIGVSYKLNEKYSVVFRNNRSLLSIRDQNKDNSLSSFFKGQYNDALMLFLSYKL